MKYTRDEQRAQSEDTTVLGEGLDHDLYRAAIYQRAMKMAGGKQPSTADLWKSQSEVDRTLGRAGITLKLPGARPGRRTI